MVSCYIIIWQYVIVCLDIENHLHASLIRSQQFHLGFTCQSLNSNAKLVDVIYSRAASIFSVHLEHLIWLLYFVHERSDSVSNVLLINNFYTFMTSSLCSWYHKTSKVITAISYFAHSVGWFSP